MRLLCFVLLITSLTTFADTDPTVVTPPHQESAQSSGTKRREAPENKELDKASAIIKLAQDYPAKDASKLPPTGKFTGMCYSAYGAKQPTWKEPFNIESLKELGNWKSESSTVTFDYSSTAVGFDAEGTVRTEKILSLPGEDHTYGTLENPIRFQKDRQSWGTELEANRTNVLGISKGNDNLDIRFGKNKAGKDLLITSTSLISHFVPARKGGVESWFRQYRFCVYNRVD